MAPPNILPSYIRVRAVVRDCGEGHTDTHTAVTNIHFALATPHAKCNYCILCNTNCIKCCMLIKQKELEGGHQGKDGRMMLKELNCFRTSLEDLQV